MTRGLKNLHVERAGAERHSQAAPSPSISGRYPGCPGEVGLLEHLRLSLETRIRRDLGEDVEVQVVTARQS
ncbi:hypothetical protein HNQ10_002566 [Deinococcus metallilatus]|uniref:Uncharacterized protein n=1 Tax=Deinococcus metallilatus TaxID=1211322 RepID=A0ABR6MUV6_9DEIO|nr:hypothetical protein [Deinococcus metallilatus]